MGSDHVAVVREMFAAVGHGDYTTSQWADPDIELVVADGPDPGSSKGISAMNDFLREFLRAWDEWRSEPEELRKLDDERVLVFVRYGGRGKASGLDLGQVSTKGAVVCHVREGKMTKVVRYWDRERALADLGLSPHG
jgi:ketosteroid isomerase-like protein